MLYASMVFWLAIAALAALVFWPRTESRMAADMIGIPLPSSATDIRASDRAGMFGGDYYVSAAISRNEYQQIVSQLGLRRRADLLEFWAVALRAYDTPWWTVSSVNDADTYFGDSEESCYIVTRYEDGRIYFKRHVY
ncbi:MAG: hypothetical protein ABI680_11995 [Chthoniobacteraceae bacterium]